MTTGDNPLGGRWLANEAAAALPDLRRAFDLNRDPLIRVQLLDLEKTEAERRGEGTGRASGMVGRDKPAPALRPPAPVSGPVDGAAFSARWLAERRDAAFAAAPARQSPAGDTPNRTRGRKERMR